MLLFPSYPSIGYGEGGRGNEFWVTTAFTPGEMPRVSEMVDNRMLLCLANFSQCEYHSKLTLSCGLVFGGGRRGGKKRGKARKKRSSRSYVSVSNDPVHVAHSQYDFTTKLADGDWNGEATAAYASVSTRVLTRALKPSWPTHFHM